MLVWYCESCFYLIPSIVSEVAAIFVATTHFLTPFGAGWNICLCWSVKKKKKLIIYIYYFTRFPSILALRQILRQANLLAWIHTKVGWEGLQQFGHGHRNGSLRSQLSQKASHRLSLFQTVLFKTQAQSYELKTNIGNIINTGILTTENLQTYCKTLK